MANKIKLSYEGIGQMLKGEEMQAFISQCGAIIADRAGDGYDFRVHNTGFRQAANIYAVTRKAQKDNAKNNTLLIASMLQL